MAARPASPFAAGRQFRRSIISAVRGGQAGIEGGVLTRHQARALEPESQRHWIAATIFSVHQRRSEERAQQPHIVERALAAIEGCGSSGPSTIRFQDVELDELPRRRHPKMVGIAISMTGEA
jgi:hypothetical protein